MKDNMDSLLENIPLFTYEYLHLINSGGDGKYPRFRLKEDFKVGHCRFD